MDSSWTISGVSREYPWRNNGFTIYPLKSIPIVIGRNWIWSWIWLSNGVVFCGYFGIKRMVIVLSCWLFVAPNSRELPRSLGSFLFLGFRKSYRRFCVYLFTNVRFCGYYMFVVEFLCCWNLFWLLNVSKINNKLIGLLVMIIICTDIIKFWVLFFVILLRILNILISFMC